MAIQTADLVISQDQGFQPQIEAQVAKAELIRAENNNATALAASLEKQSLYDCLMRTEFYEFCMLVWENPIDSRSLR